MNQIRYYRKYPRTHDKSDTAGNDYAFNLNLLSALGILSFTLVQGIFLGYMLKKKFHWLNLVGVNPQLSFFYTN